ncbi:unnamed protein product [Rangifer tarandus platyrhynchus]|uniref:Uncharacterized protein n=2 Tax=Rangifer tarandus platyrhynchus TaxID=3082113 RepID=A0ACB0F0Y4_RANTA|nr:unnamed protein product [Rangifer tarandus platyrhynchus]CAI9706302.1 unnamed protein product [Rangifer tarandus platyrhynchus]
MILCAGRPRMSSENQSLGATAAGAPGPCSWCPFHFLSGNTFPLVFTETVRLDGMSFVTETEVTQSPEVPFDDGIRALAASLWAEHHSDGPLSGDDELKPLEFGNDTS